MHIVRLCAISHNCISVEEIFVGHNSTGRVCHGFGLVVEGDMLNLGSSVSRSHLG